MTNPKFQQLMNEIRQKVGEQAAWDLNTPQYVRRAEGKAPTAIHGSTFQDLVDKMIVVRTKDPRAKPQVFILAVFEAKFHRTRGGLVSRGGE